ncbi:TetR/AcrR family transcriptional regulator [Asticcacaulis sp. 201]|uniref:TetR/AcrR family transcriptional regulator n=1 Tax=Asticcacaulis sp. 201 TaxID=3028787 RepID=UPI002915C882|nr:TetR family transcriptional regulator C-terminal domain-containing protein [Asticcacaulis sp. 201]MDV6333117.1 TetR family transcriptional regulator C-terminal domain-containing protein [Asticcacaulis sp. 201]
MSEFTLPRSPSQTRQRLVEAAFEEVYHSGFRSSDINAILTKAGVTKGALYHHFTGKEALGHAVVEQVIAKITSDKWLAPLDDVDDPIDALLGILNDTALSPAEVNGGCPLNNLAQEMSPLDEGFRRRLSEIFTTWISGVADALRLGQVNGKVRRDLDPVETATFFIATYEGYISMAKVAQDPRVLDSGLRQLRAYLHTLRR